LHFVLFCFVLFRDIFVVVVLRLFWGRSHHLRMGLLSTTLARNKFAREGCWVADTSTEGYWVAATQARSKAWQFAIG
jgi:hypothetical protein